MRYGIRAARTAPVLLVTFLTGCSEGSGAATAPTPSASPSTGTAAVGPQGSGHRSRRGTP